MVAWAKAQAAAGHDAEAAQLAARLREFHNPQSAPFFAPCAEPASAAKAFQCQTPAAEPVSAGAWRKFIR